MSHLHPTCGGLFDQMESNLSARSACGSGCNTRSQRRGRQRSWAGSKRWIETGRDRVDTRCRCARITKLIIDLDELDLRELFKIQHKRTCDVIQCAVRLAAACEIHVGNAVDDFRSVIARKTIANDRQSLIALHAPGALEEFIEHSEHRIPGRRNGALHFHLIWDLAGNQPVIICKVQGDRSKHRCTRGRREPAWRAGRRCRWA